MFTENKIAMECCSNECPWQTVFVQMTLHNHRTHFEMSIRTPF